MSLVLGIDLGSRRVGLALSDPSGVLASPYEVVPRDAALHQRIARVVEDLGVDLVVVGLPLALDGSRGPAALAALAEAEELRNLLSVPVESFDERLTTATADRALIGRGMKAPARRRVVDKVAAAVMLQGWLDRRAAPRAP